MISFIRIKAMLGKRRGSPPSEPLNVTSNNVKRALFAPVGQRLGTIFDANRR